MASDGDEHDQPSPETSDASDPNESSEEEYDMEDHRILLLGYIEEDQFDQLALIDKILLDIAFMLAEEPEATSANVKLYRYFDELDVSQPYQARIGIAIKSLEHGISFIPDTDKWKPHLLSGLSLSLKLRFEDLGEIKDVEEAIKHGNQAVALTPPGHASLPVVLDILGGAYTARFEKQGRLSDIKTAIEHRTKAVKLAPSNHKERTTFLTNLGASLTTQSLYLDDGGGLDEAIETLNQAALLTPDDCLGKPRRLNNLGIAFKTRFDHFGQIDDIRSAIKHQTRALFLLPERHDDRPLIIGSLGSSYAGQYRHHGNLEDLEISIAHLTQALDLTTRANSDSPAWLHNLGNSLQERFQRLGRLADIDRAIECHQNAVLRFEGHRWHSGHLVGLGSSYLIRYGHLKNVADIESSIECYHEALSLVPSETFWGTSILNNLGNVYFRRFEQFRDLEDIDSSINYYNQATSLLNDKHPTKPTFLSNLGQAYSERFLFFRQLSDIEKSINLLGQAISLTLADQSSKRDLLMILAHSLHLRFQQTQGRDDLDLCINHASKALSITPQEHIKRLDILKALGDFHRTQFECFHEISMIQRSIFYFQEALRSPLGRPSARFYAAWDLCGSLRLAGPTSLLIPAYKQVIQLFPQLVWLGNDISNRHNTLLEIEDVAMEAAAAAIELYEFDLALEWIEAGSSVVWKQMGQLRTPFDELHVQHPELAERLKIVARQLDSDAPHAFSGEHSHKTESVFEQANQQRHRLSEEWEHLLEQVRLLPGFTSFLLPKTAAELMSAAIDSHVVVVNLHRSRCDALILSKGKNHPVHLPLPGFSYQKAVQGKTRLSEFLRSSNFRTRGFRLLHSGGNQGIENVLGVLWKDVVWPVVGRLGFLKPPPTGRQLPRITWCLTGPLVFLPLHAAGIYTKPQARAFDFVVSSYAPTPSALLLAASRLSPSCSILGVAQPNSPGFEPIPGTFEEIRQIQRHVGRAHTFTSLVGEHATATAVLDAMQKHSWVHLACHATQDSEDALDSAFHLYKSELDLRTIMATSLDHASFAFLSACQTAMGDEYLAEQAMHLAAGMIVAGYPSVVATMWSIEDQDGPDVAEKLYAYMLEGGAGDSRKGARALHAALGHLRDKIGDDSFARWVPFIHIGI